MTKMYGNGLMFWVKEWTFKPRNGLGDLDVIFNTVIFISKWEIWKIRNKVKYNQSRIGDQTIFNSWKNNFKKHLQYTLKTLHINEIDKSILEPFRNNI
jgi:hypothetical protein